MASETVTRRICDVYGKTRGVKRYRCTFEELNDDLTTRAVLDKVEGDLCEQGASRAELFISRMFTSAKRPRKVDDQPCLTI